MFDRKAKFLLLFADIVLSLGCLSLIFSIRMHWLGIEIYRSLGLWFIIGVNLVNLYVFSAYDLGGEVSWQKLFSRISVAMLFGLFIVTVANYLVGKERSGLFGRGVFLGFEILFFTVAYSVRFFIIKTLRKMTNQMEWLFITAQDMLGLIEKELKANHFPGRAVFQTDLNLVGENLKRSWAGVVLALDRRGLRENEKLSQILMMARFEGLMIYDICSLYERLWRKIPVHFLDFEWFISSEGFYIFSSPIGLKLKRLSDLFLASFLILLVWPLMIFAFLLIKMDSEGATVYSQVRTGKDGKEFTIFKFRTMRIDAEKDGPQWAKNKDNRITRVGAFLRKTRIDELPQLFNILKGEMSFIGPRPERPEFNKMLEEKIPFYSLRHLVPPGLTGWAQIFYPYGASLEDAVQKLQYELFYIKNQGLLMDLTIVLRTFQVVLFGRGR